MADYTSYGYGASLTKMSAREYEPMISSADSRLMIGGMGAAQIGGGDLQEDITISGGSISIKNEGGKTMIILNAAGIFIKDEASDNDMLTLNKLGITLNDNKNDRMRIGILDE